MKIAPQQIIWSADVTLNELTEVVMHEALPKGTVIKLDRLFFIKYGLKPIQLCQKKGYPVFADTKIVEIPDKVMEITKEYLRFKPWMLNAMAGICSSGELPKATDENFENDKKIDALARFAKLCKDAGTKSCAVTVLTSKTDDMVLNEYDASAKDQVLTYVRLMKECRLTDIVCSPKEAEFIRQDTTFDSMSINTPGIRMPDSSADDQARILTPAKALATCSNRLVIGRDLTGRDTSIPIVERVSKNYQRIIEHIESA